MISVLIPVYNYEISNLINELYKQLQLCNIAYEIICFDDKSSANYILKNELKITDNNITYFKSDNNIGRVKARQTLANMARFDWLLFLDADIFPKDKTFIENYINTINTGYDAIYGGFAYHKNAPGKNYLLRWTYGKTHEQIPAIKRNLKPYKIVISANFLIKKNTFLKLNSKITKKGYGFDNYFGALLQKENVKVLHINNEVFHLGIEESSIYLKKKEKAAETLLYLLKKDPKINHQNDLLHLFVTLKKFQLHYVFSLLFKLFKRYFKRNLLGNSPNMMMLQLYRICYMCNKSLGKL